MSAGFQARRVQDPGSERSPGPAPIPRVKGNGEAAEQPAGALLSEVPEKAVDVLAAFADHLSDLASLQTWRLQSKVQEAMLMALCGIAAGGLTLAGLVFVSVGAVEALSVPLGSRAGAWALVGGVHVLLALVTVLVTRNLAKRGRATSEDLS
jgi:hypothetical protein